MRIKTAFENKRILSSEEYKKCILDELSFLHNHCVKHGITYYLIFGTLLGAVRHNGFIPWDDDVDVILPRQDYYKLLSSLSSSNCRYSIFSCDTNSDFTAPLAKLVDKETVLIQNYAFKEKVEMGAYIDLYILDGLPNEKNQADLYDDYCMKLLHHWSIANSRIIRSKKTVIKDVLRFVYYLPIHLRGYKYYLNKIDEAAKKYKFDNGDYVGNLTFANTHDVWKREDFVPVEHEFEGLSFFIPRGYDKILTIRYGDWRKLPPESEQHSEHNFICYWKY